MNGHAARPRSATPAGASSTPLFGADRVRPGDPDQPWAVWITSSGDVLDRPSRDEALVTAAQHNAHFASAHFTGDLAAGHAVVLRNGYAWHPGDDMPTPRITVDPRQAHVQLAEVWREQVRLGHLAPGAELPRRDALAAQHGVSLSTVKRAQELLRDEGVLALDRTRAPFMAIVAHPAAPADPLPGFDLTPVPHPRSATPDTHITARMPHYQRVANEVEEQILSGALPPGARLPTARVLGARFGCSAAVARDALRILRARDLVVTALDHTNCVASRQAARADRR